MAITVGYNEEWVKSTSWEDFHKNQKHHEKDTDLKADWERITGKKVHDPKPQKTAPHK